jgi:cellobiose phosphorylase
MNTVGNKGRGESIWLGWFLYRILQDFIPLCRQRRDNEREERYREFSEKILTALEKEGWDGSWYRRAYFDEGTPLGSVRNSECRIDSIAQSWSVISGAAKPSRMEEAMSAVEKYLVDREEGIIKLLTPPFDTTEPDPGYIKGYVPGVRENGGQYTHAAAWVILAFAKLGAGAKAWELFNMISPVNHARTPIEAARYKVEPYVMAADVYSAAPHMGRGGWTWYTGASGWLYRIGVEYMTGFSKRGTQLAINPCIPGGWPGFSMSYRYGSTVYDIAVENPEGVCTGVRSIFADGIECSCGAVELVDDGKVHSVRVIMG